MLDRLTDRQAVEVFHLLFLRAAASGPHRAQLIVKGGCNLRFFFGSIRYSEDLDVDVTIVAKETLRKNVDKVLASPVLRRPLAAYGLEIAAVSSPTQTETTQRWKIQLEARGRTLALPTKIEFSRRGMGGESRLEPVDTGLARGYQMTPPLVGHYLLSAAIEGKIGALAGRAEVQARDVFDLALLLARSRGDIPATSATKKIAPKAAERAMEFSYDEYVAQVVAYLAPEEAAPYATREAWEAQQLEVVDALERLGR